MRPVFSAERLSSCCQAHCVSLNSPPTTHLPPSIPITKAHTYFPRVNVQQVPTYVCALRAKCAWANGPTGSRRYQKVFILLTSFPFTQHIPLRKTAFSIKINHFPLSYAISPVGEWKNLGTNSGSRLRFPPLPTVRYSVNEKTITALLPTWDAFCRFYCAFVRIARFNKMLTNHGKMPGWSENDADFAVVGGSLIVFR